MSSLNFQWVFVQTDNVPVICSVLRDITQPDLEQPQIIVPRHFDNSVVEYKNSLRYHNEMTSGTFPSQNHE